MRKLTFIMVTCMCLCLIAQPTSVSANQVSLKLGQLNSLEKGMLNQPRMFEDSNERAPAKSIEQSPDEDTPNASPEIEAEAYILMDDRTGKVLAQKAKDDPRPPASMTKMMTAYLVLDQIKQKRINWNDEVVVSKRAAAIDEAQIFLVENERITVEELFIGIMVQSGNDAAVALAEHVGDGLTEPIGHGSEEGFVKQMNRKALEWGLTNTHFNNATGLDHKDYPNPPNSPGDHVMSAADTAKLAQHLIHDHPIIFDYTTITHHTFHPGTDREQKSTNWNRMLPELEQEYQGVDGIKTGSTSTAGYCFTGTVKQGNKRLISVVMGAKSMKKRFEETAKLYDYGLPQSKNRTNSAKPSPTLKKAS